MTKMVSPEIWEYRTKVVRDFVDGKITAAIAIDNMEVSKPTLYLYARKLCSKEFGGEGLEKLTDKRFEKKGYRPRPRKLINSEND